VLEVVRWRPVSVLRPAAIVGLVAIAVLVLLFMTTAVLLLLNI
jgi:hypothetical protein